MKKTSVQVTLLLFLVRHVPPFLRFCMICIIGTCYYLGSFKARKAIRQFQKQVIASGGNIKQVSTFKTILSFSFALVEKVQGWSHEGKQIPVTFSDDDISLLTQSISNGKGAVLVGNHLGNMDLMRCIALYGGMTQEKPLTVTAIRDLGATTSFDNSVNALDSNMLLYAIDAGNITPATIELLQERIDSGGIVVVTGDRIPSSQSERTVCIPFLGKDTQFPIGAYAIASMLGADVYFMTAVRKQTLMVNAEYNMYVSKCPVNMTCKRSERNAMWDLCAREYASFLEKYAKLYPFQWYNFFNFWRNEK